MLLILAPGGFDRFVAELGEPTEQLVLPDRVAPDLARVMAVAAAHGIQLLPPPGADPSPPWVVEPRRRGVDVTTLDAWVVEWFATIDSMDSVKLAEAFAEEGTFRFGNSEAAVGRRQIEQAISGFFSMIEALHHNITGVWSGSWEGGAVKSVEAEVTYTRRGGTRTPPLPVTSTIRLRGDRIQDYRIFMDVAPLFSDAS